MSGEKESMAARESRASRPRIALLLGLLAGFLLVALFTARTAYDAWRARIEVHELVEEAEQVLALAGRISRSLVEERSLVSAAVVSSVPSKAESTRQEVEAIEARIDLDIAALEPRLDEAELASWEAQRSRLAELRCQFLEVLRAIERGDDPDYRSLTEAGDLVDQARADLELLAEENELEASVLLGRADERLRGMVIAQFAGGAALLVAIGVIFFSLQRMTANALERIEQSNRDLDAFAGRIAHDVRNALSPIGLAGELLRSSPDRETALFVAEELGRSTSRARRLLDGLLAFSRGEFRRSDARTNVDRACRDVLAELAPTVEQLAAAVEHELEPGLVALAPELLHLVLANVVGNAVKFLDGRDPRRVRIRGTIVGATYVIEIEDTGPGIPEASIEQIFEPFYRVPGTKIVGTGIGLATVRRIVDAHGGEVRVRSTHGKGSLFLIRLPLVASTPEERDVRSLIGGEAEPVEHA